MKWSRQVRVARLVAACAGLVLAACGAPRPGDVVLVSIDTLRADHLGLYGYGRDTSPRIDGWFADGAIYLRAYSTEASTSPSVVSLLTGQLPQEHGVRLFYQLLEDAVATLPDRLPEAYQSAAFVSNMVLTDEAIGLADRFDHYDDFVGRRESGRDVFERRAAPTTAAVLRWLETGADPDRPLFLWVHYIDPHGPYDAPPPWRHHFRSEQPRPIDLEQIPEFERIGDLNDANAYVARYDSEIAYTDAEVGRLLDGLARLRGIDDSLVVLTSDHGESMTEHERWFTHGYHVYEEIIRVPLLLRGPGVASGRFEVPVSGADVADTLLAFAGAPVRAGAPDLRRPESLDPRRIVFSEASLRKGQVRAAIRGDRKALAFVSEEKRKILTGRGYDLAADPDEARPLQLPPNDSLARELLERAQADPDPGGIPTEYREGIKLSAPKVAPGVSERELERLRRLGYAQ